MLPTFVASATLQNALLASFQTFSGNDCNCNNRRFCFFQEVDKPLQQVTLQVTSDSECKSVYNSPGDITDRMICAGDVNGGKGACQVIGS